MLNQPSTVLTVTSATNASPLAASPASPTPTGQARPVDPAAIFFLTRGSSHRVEFDKLKINIARIENKLRIRSFSNGLVRVCQMQRSVLLI